MKLEQFNEDVGSHTPLQIPKSSISNKTNSKIIKNDYESNKIKNKNALDYSQLLKSELSGNNINLEIDFQSDDPSMIELNEQFLNLKILYESRLCEVEKLYEELNEQDKTISDLTNYISKQLESNQVPLINTMSNTLSSQLIECNDVDNIKLCMNIDTETHSIVNELELDKKIIEKENEIKEIKEVNFVLRLI